MHAKCAAGASYLSSLACTLSALIPAFDLNDALAAVGILTALGTFFYNRRHARNREAREARQAALDEEIKRLTIQKLKEET